MRGTQLDKNYVVLGVGEVAKNSEGEGNRKRGSRPSLEDSAGSS